MKQSLTIFLFLFFGLKAFAQQDINFSQFYELPLLRNPALAGIFNGNARFSAAYRNQWQSITVPYSTMAFGAEMKFFKGLSDGDFVTAGFQVTNDQAGDSKLKRTQFLPVLNYHKLINEEYNTLIALAFMGGPVTESFDASQLKFDDQFVNGSYSASNPTSQTFKATSFSYIDASTGLSFNSYINDNTKIYLGVGLYHFNKPSLSFMLDNTIHLNKKWVFNAGLTSYTSNYDKVVIYADYFRQGGNRIAQGGILFTHNLDEYGDETNFSISGGAVYRFKDAFIPIIKIQTSKLNAGFSYDVNISKLKNASKYMGGFEFTLSYKDFWNKQHIEAQRNKCPVNIW